MTPIKILYFAWVREKVGRSEETVEVPGEVVKVGDLIGFLKGRGEEYASAFERSDVIRAALDQTHVKQDQPITGAREIAFFPPVTGG